MTDAYSVGGGDDAGGSNVQSAQPTMRTPFRGMRVRSRSTGQTYYWVNGQYVQSNDPRRLSASDLAIRNSAQSQATLAQQMLPDMNRFEELNSHTPTGALPQIIGSALGNQPQYFQGNLGSRTGENDIAEMNSIANRWTPRLRPAGSGNSSDTDVRFYAGALPSRANVGPANSRIIQDIRRNGQLAQDQADFYEWYWPQTGTLNNAQQYWARYQAAREQNPNLSWRQYFGAADGQSQQPQQGQAQQQSQPRVGQTRTFPNGRTGRWDGHGWVQQ